MQYSQINASSGVISLFESMFNDKLKSFMFQMLQQVIFFASRDC